MTARRASLTSLVTAAALVGVRIALALLAGSVSALADATRAAAELGQVLVSEIVAHHEDHGAPRPAYRDVGAIEGVAVVAAGLVAGFAALRGLGASGQRPALGAFGMLGCAVIARLVSDRFPTRPEARSLARTPGTAVLAAGGLAVSAMLSSAIPDVVVALVIAGVVVKTGIDLALTAVRGRERLRGDELAHVADALAHGPPEVVGYGHVGARTAARARRIDVDVTIVRDASDARLPEIRREIEAAIHRRLSGTRIVVHLRKPPPPKVETGEGTRRHRS